MLLRKKNYDLFDDFFADMFDDSFFSSPARTALPQMMKTDIVEKDGQYLLDIELPGYDRNDISAELKDGYLTISASKEDVKEEKDKKGNYVRRERFTGNVKRSYYVGENIKEEDIQAGFKDGILRIAVAKQELKEVKEERKLIPIL